VPPRSCILHDPTMDTKAKLLLAGLALIVLAFMVIYGLLAILGGPSCC